MQGVTFENIHKLTTFEIRQILEKEGVTLPENPNYNTLLQCLVVELQGRKENEEKRLFQESREKEQRHKQEILERKAERKAKYKRMKQRELEPATCTGTV